MTNNPFNTFAQVVDNLIALNMAFKADRDFLEDESDEFVLNHFCTIQLDIGRLTGKTTYIANNAINEKMAIVSSEKEKLYLLKINSKAQVFTINEFMALKTLGIPYCFIDDPSLVFLVNSRQELIKKSCQLGIEMLILLGN